MVILLNTCIKKRENQIKRKSEMTGHHFSDISVIFVFLYYFTRVLKKACRTTSSLAMIFYSQLKLNEFSSTLLTLM